MSLTGQERKVCRLLGLSPETFVAVRDGGRELRVAGAEARLSESDRQVCAALGLPPEKFLEAAGRTDAGFTIMGPAMPLWPDERQPSRAEVRRH